MQADDEIPLLDLPRRSQQLPVGNGCNGGYLLPHVLPEPLKKRSLAKSGSDSEDSVRTGSVGVRGMVCVMPLALLCLWQRGQREVLRQC